MVKEKVLCRFELMNSLGSTSNPFVAIVILNWNGQRFLEQFLPFVFKTTFPNYKVWVADNASSDDSVTFLKKKYPSVNIISLEKNYGFAKGYNEALKQVRADYYVLLNSDVEVTPGWLEPMVALLEADKMIAACQPKILSWDQRTLFEYAGAAGGWIDKYGYPFAKGRVFDICEVDRGQYDRSEPVFWATGASLFIRSDVFHAMNGFDEFFFAHQEEIDLCWRIQLAGYKIYSCPASVVYHVGGGTLPRGNSRKTFLNFRNNLIMLAKNLPAGEKWYRLPLRMALDQVAAAKSLLQGEAGYFIAVIKSHLAFIRWLFSPKDKKFLPSKKDGKLYGVVHKNIAWLYFVKGKKRFFEIVDQGA